MTVASPSTTDDQQEAAQQTKAFQSVSKPQVPALRNRHSNQPESCERLSDRLADSHSGDWCRFR